jgi:hypothetical protein
MGRIAVCAPLIVTQVREYRWTEIDPVVHTREGKASARSHVGSAPFPMVLPRGRRIYDLNKPEDRVYLLKRGFVWAVIYPHGEKRGAHRDEKGVKFILRYLKDVKVDVVKIADYPDNLD